MRKIYKRIFAVISLSLLVNLAFGQNSFFISAGFNAIKSTDGQQTIFPKKYFGYSANIDELRTFLWTLPDEKNLTVERDNALIMEIPMPNGKMAKFKVWESNIMSPGLAAKYPDMRQFLGQGIDDPYATIRFDYNPFTGFHGQILSAKTGRIMIDPYANGDLGFYMSYYSKDATSPDGFVCINENDNPVQNRQNLTTASCLGTDLRTYRLALACTGEYAHAVDGANPTVAGVLAAMNTAVNRVTGVYENELSVRMELIPNNNLLVYLDGNTDPYTNNSGFAMLSQNQTNVDNVIGSANYDIGHVFSTGGGGVASLGVVCVNGFKARGVTGLPNPVGDPFYIDYVAHEMGHQYSGNHTFNSQSGSCGGGNRNGSTAYEVGSGNTIMAYAGICGSDDIQPHSDPVFQAISFDEISNHVTSTSCAVITSTGNTLPIINSMPSNKTIPIGTPFTLTGTATDANGDALTYSWEEMDLGPAGAWNNGANSTTAPLFKPRLPKTTGSRTFPDISVILAGYPTNPPATTNGLKGETLPQVARQMKFRLTVRDNRAGGGGVVSSGTLGCQNSNDVIITTAGSTPFALTTPNGGESYPAGSSQTITWNKAGTDAAPFNVANVKISLSTDGGLTYPTVVIASTPNDGSEVVTIPSVPATTTARIKIEAIGNYFFDISDANFSITIPPNGFSFNSPAPVTANCPAPVTMISGNLVATYLGNFTGDINLTATVSPSFPANVNFPTNPLTPNANSTTVELGNMSLLPAGTYTLTVIGTGVGGPTITRDITFTINPGSGPSITSQPSNQTKCVGEIATFSVTATGASAYQWELSTDGGTNYNPISGATNSAYNVSNVTAGMDGYKYRCIVTGQCGVSTSNAATLTVNTKPMVTSNPDDVSVCSGSAASFEVTGTGSAISYQWQESIDNGANWESIPGATSPTYTIASTTVGMDGNLYRCVVQGACAPATTSGIAKLTVNSSVTVTGNPLDITVCEGLSAGFAAAASGSNLGYQWQVSTDNGNNWNNISNNSNYAGATTPSLMLNNIPPSFHHYQYRCYITSAPCTPGITNPATLTVNTYPNVQTNPTDVTICEGGNASFSVSATTGVGSLSYQWQFSQPGSSSWNNIPGATSNVYNETNIPVGQDGYEFRCVVTAGCGSSISNTAAITVNANPVFDITNLPAHVCLTDASFSLTASQSGGLWSGNGVSATVFLPADAGVGTHTISYVMSNNGCVTTKSSSIQVNECAQRHITINKDGAVKVYPVPNDGRFQIGIFSDLYDAIGVKIFNDLGQQVYAQQFVEITYGSAVSVDISGVPNGVYHLFIYGTANGKTETKGVSIIVNR
ncbi:MAG: M12 family metallo-peptidase [Chitinophagaceae bacterium]